MHHADTRTFLRYYLSRRINKNLPAIIRGLNLCIKCERYFVNKNNFEMV